MDAVIVFEEALERNLKKAIESAKDEAARMTETINQRSLAERAVLNETIESQAQEISELKASVMKLQMDAGGVNQTMDHVREKLASTFGSGPPFQHFIPSSLSLPPLKRMYNQVIVRRRRSIFIHASCCIGVHMPKEKLNEKNCIMLHVRFSDAL